MWLQGTCLVDNDGFGKRIRLAFRWSHCLAVSKPEEAGLTSIMQRWNGEIHVTMTSYFQNIWTDKLEERHNPQTDLSEIFVSVLFSPAAAQPKQPVCTLWHRLFLVLLLHQSLHQTLVPVQLCEPGCFWGWEEVAVCLLQLRQALDALLSHQMTWEVET